MEVYVLSGQSHSTNTSCKRFYDFILGASVECYPKGIRWVEVGETYYVFPTLSTLVQVAKHFYNNNSDSKTLPIYYYDAGRNAFLLGWITNEILENYTIYIYSALDNLKPFFIRDTHPMALYGANKPQDLKNYLKMFLVLYQNNIKVLKLLIAIKANRRKMSRHLEAILNQVVDSNNIRRAKIWKQRQKATLMSINVIH